MSDLDVKHLLDAVLRLADAVEELVRLAPHKRTCGCEECCP